MPERRLLQWGLQFSIFVQFCSIMWWLSRFRWVGARSWELAANSYGARPTASMRRTPQVVEMDPGRDAAGRRSKCCIFVQKSSIIEQNQDFGSTVGYQKHNMDSRCTCIWGRPPSACRNFWPIWIPTNSEWYLFWPRPLAKLLGGVFWAPEELTVERGGRAFALLV